MNTTKAIDSQTITAPQYGIGLQSATDAPKATRKSRRQKRHERDRGSDAAALRQGTRDLKLCIRILEQEIRIEKERASSKQSTLGSLLQELVEANERNPAHRFNPHVSPLLRAMTDRLALLRRELAARDLRDLRQGKKEVKGSFLSLGARVRWAA